MGILRAERGPANLTLKHDCTKTPPVTVLSITMAAEDLRGNVVRSANSGVGHESTGLTPVVNNATVANREINLIKVDRIAITRPIRLSLE